MFNGNQCQAAESAVWHSEATLSCRWRTLLAVSAQRGSIIKCRGKSAGIVDMFYRRQRQSEGGLLMRNQACSLPPRTEQEHGLCWPDIVVVVGLPYTNVNMNIRLQRSDTTQCRLSRTLLFIVSSVALISSRWKNWGAWTKSGGRAPLSDILVIKIILVLVSFQSNHFYFI